MVIFLRFERRYFVELRPEDQVWIGEIPYRVKAISRGGMGLLVFLHHDYAAAPGTMSPYGFRLALKACLPGDADGDEFALFKRELTVWAGFRHSCVVRLKAIFDGGESGWIAAMDWCAGSLRDVLKRENRLSTEMASRIVLRMAMGLEHAFIQDRVLHLDVKPENILYRLSATDPGGGGTPGDRSSIEDHLFQLSDWGIASIKQRRLNAIAGMPISMEAAQQTFNNIGTPFYMAPERFCEGFVSSVASDIFSLGMIYVEMLTGHLPYRPDMHPVESLSSGQYFRDAEAILKKAKIHGAIRFAALMMLAPRFSSRPADYESVKKEIAKGLQYSKGFLAKIFR